MVRRLALLVILIGFATPTAAGYPVDERRLGNWSVFTWMSDTHQFAFCAARISYPDGRETLISIGAGGLLMTGDISGSELSPGQVIPTVVRVDEDWHAPYSAVIRGDPAAPMVLIQFGWDPGAFDALRQGATMTLLTERLAYDFLLLSPDGAFQHMRSCAETHLNQPIFR